MHVPESDEEMRTIRLAFRISRISILAIVGLVAILAWTVPGANAGLFSPSRPDTDYFNYLPVVNHPPRMHIWGRVTLADGTGLANIEIMSGVVYWYTAPVVAQTDANGYYDALIECPYDHDETMGVCPVSEYYTFEPPAASWRSYGECPGTQADFVATPVNSKIQSSSDRALQILRAGIKTGQQEILFSCSR